MQSKTSLRNIGIFAHVDAGKTTTTEHLLYRSGKTRTLGSVDDGTAQTDWLEVERDRGISVRSATTQLDWRGVAINLVDTPGHVDFSSEVERCLRVMDGAVLIVSAAEGVQAHTEVIWHALRKLNIPTLLYINKMDRIGASAEAALAEIHRYLSPAAAPIQLALGQGETFAGVAALLEGGRRSGKDGGESPAPTAPASSGAASRAPSALAPIGGAVQSPSEPSDAAVAPSAEQLREGRMRLLEIAAEQDEWLLERYVAEQPVGEAELAERLLPLVHAGKLYPVLYGASSRGQGVSELLDALVDWLPAPQGTAAEPLSGVVFKIERDKTMGRMAIVRLYGGELRNRDGVANHTQGIQEKVTQIRKMDGQKAEDIGVLRAGDIAAVCGLSQAQIGDILGSPAAVPPAAKLAVPLLTVQVRWRDKQDYPAVVAALQELADEDPLLDLQWLQDERELHVKVMGPIQLEILSSLLKSRFNLEVAFGEPSVIYKETPSKAGEGFVAYLSPKPCWAVLRFKIEPLPRGAGLRYRSIVRQEACLERYQNQVAETLPEALQQGLKGWEVVDLDITLVEGQHHVWHTHPLDFVVATPMGIMNGLQNTGTTLLEPMLQFRITVPEEFGGKVLHDLTVMRASFETPAIRQGRFVVEGLLPVATSLDYPIKLSSATKGRGTFSSHFGGYQECPPEVQAERKRRGINPLDQAKYILSVRKAL